MNAADVMDSVVAHLVDAIEAGATEWQMPWRSLASTGWPTNAATGNRYSGGNVLALYFAAVDHDYPTARWATYKQWQTLGAQVRKGERGTLGIFWKVTDPADDDTDDQRDTDDQTAPSTQRVGSSVHRVQRRPGRQRRRRRPRPPSSPIRSTATPAPKRSSPPCPPSSAGAPETRATGPPPTTSSCPRSTRSTAAADAYGTLAHELTHWTGHPTRLARTYGKRFGDDAYAAEELVAELGAAFVCALIGIDSVARTDHAGYLAHWCRMLPSPAIDPVDRRRQGPSRHRLARRPPNPPPDPAVNVTVSHPGYRQTIGPALAVAAVAAALRGGHTVTVSRPDHPTRFALTATSRAVTTTPVNPDLFAVHPAVPAWVERLTAAAADLL